MALVGPLPLTLPFTPGLEPYPVVRFYLTTSPAGDPSPVWVDRTAFMRSYATSRGKSNELDAFDAGTATVELDDRTRIFDPTVTAAIKPFNRGWLFEDFRGTVRDLFKGYAESYVHSYDSSGIVDSVATVRFTDEFKVLTLGALPTTSPPRDTYGELVQADIPDGYWPMTDDPATLVQTPAPPTPGEIADPSPPAPPSSAPVPGKLYGRFWGHFPPLP